MNEIITSFFTIFGYFIVFAGMPFLIIAGIIEFVKRKKYIPVVGDVLTLRTYGDNPFNDSYIKITEIKDDWVQYMFMPDALSSNAVSRFSISMPTLKKFYIKVS